MTTGKPRAVIFDWDNTLVDTWPTIHAALFETFTAMQVEPWTLEQTKQRVRRSMRESFPELFGSRWTDARDIFYEAYERLHLERLIACDGAEDALAALKNHDLYLAVVSNKTGHYLREEARYLGWNSYFGQIIGAGDADRDKPAPEPVHMALLDSDISPGEDVWMIGDSGVDMEIAHAAGLVPVLLRGGTPSPGEFDKFAPRFRVSDCRELKEMILSL